MNRAHDGRLGSLLAQAQQLLAVFERVPAPPAGSLEELQMRLARAHAHGLVDQLAEIVASNGEPRHSRPRAAIGETASHKALRTHSRV